MKLEWEEAGLLALGLVHRYARCVDAKDRAGLAACFTVDAQYSVVVRDKAPVTCTGRDEIVELNYAVAAAQTVKRRHLVTNVIFTDMGAESCLTIVELDDVPHILAVADVQDTFRHDGEQLRIERRVISLDREL